MRRVALAGREGADPSLRAALVPLVTAAARALVDRDDMDTEAIARKAMEIAADICVYTNTQLIVEKL